MNTIRKFSPFVIQMVGNRRQGKSYMVNHLCRALRDQFDLIISFMGSKHCNPELGGYLEGQGFGDFLFHKWDNEFMDRLEEQQMELMDQERKRRVLILVDDITMDFADREKLAHLCCRGRHFYVSVAMLSVSYSSFHKSCRRSADFIFLFSMGCQSDRELMASEFAHKKASCMFYIDQITAKEHTCAVLNLNQKVQKVFWYKAPLLTEPTPAESSPNPGKSRRPLATGQTRGGGDADGRHPAQSPAPERRESPVGPVSSDAC